MFRIKVPANSAIVRTGKFGGLKIVTGRSASVLCLPWVHSHAIVTFAAKKLELELGGSFSVLTKDQLAVTCQAEVSLNSLRDQAAILQQLRSGAADKKSSQVLDETLRRKCMSGIREIIAAREYADLQGGLSVNDPEELSRLISQLASQGFSVESLQISNISLADTSSLDEGSVIRMNNESLQNEIQQKEKAEAQVIEQQQMNEARAAEMAAISKKREERSQQLINEQEKKTEDMLAAIAQKSNEIRQAIANENKPDVVQDSGDDDLELDGLKTEMAAEAENEESSAENKLAQHEKTTTEQVEKATDDMLSAYQKTDTTEQWQESQAEELEVGEEQQKKLVEAEVEAQKQKLAGEQERREASLKGELADVQGQEAAAKEARQQATEQLADVKVELERNREDTSDG